RSTAAAARPVASSPGCPATARRAALYTDPRSCPVNTPRPPDVPHVPRCRRTAGQCRCPGPQLAGAPGPQLAGAPGPQLAGPPARLGPGPPGDPYPDIWRYFGPAFRRAPSLRTVTPPM